MVRRAPGSLQPKKVGQSFRPQRLSFLFSASRSTSQENQPDEFLDNQKPNRAPALDKRARFSESVVAVNDHEMQEIFTRGFEDYHL